ncbi:MAG: hypothetical protein U1E29_17155 [Coriobacteriia bacterium]|nr:hypothetical protein [Coriobacteriia bacterium]
MIPGVDIDELWAYRPNASDLYNIERSVNPPGGGGARYIQIRKTQLPDLLQFLDLPTVPDHPVALKVRSHFEPDKIDTIVFDVKSQERMRIANQNRHWRTRASGWSPAAGFPTLSREDTTKDAEKIIASLGGLHIYLVRDVESVVWAGFTTGMTPPAVMADLPFVKLMYGSSNGGYWRFKEGRS